MSKPNFRVMSMMRSSLGPPGCGCVYELVWCKVFFHRIHFLVNSYTSHTFSDYLMLCLSFLSLLHNTSLFGSNLCDISFPPLKHIVKTCWQSLLEISLIQGQRHSVPFLFFSYKWNMKRVIAITITSSAWFMFSSLLLFLCLSIYFVHLLTLLPVF